MVWGPNSDKAVQITTNDYLNTEQGDVIANLPPDIIIEAIHHYMAAVSVNAESI